MQYFHTWVILLINQSEEIGENNFQFLGSIWRQISPSLYVQLNTCTFVPSAPSLMSSIELSTFYGKARTTCKAELLQIYLLYCILYHQIV